MGDPQCSSNDCHQVAWNFCGKCGMPTCRAHSIEDEQYEEGYACADCASPVAKMNYLRKLTNEPRVQEVIQKMNRGWGEVVTLSGGTQTKCERCQENLWEVSVKTRDDQRHKYCACCLGMIVESYLQANPKVVRLDLSDPAKLSPEDQRAASRLYRKGKTDAEGK